MFREMRRKGQALSLEECIGLLKTEPRGVLSVLGEEGYPYGMPMDHWYCEENGKIYFHSSKVGHRQDAVKQHDKVSFCVYDAGYREEGHWALHIRSVIVFGRLRVVEDHQRALELVRRLGLKYTQDAEYIQREIQSFGDKVLCYELTPEQITGKLVKES